MKFNGVSVREWRFLSLLIFCGLFLLLRLMILFFGDPQRFPISTIKIAATYQHISRKEIEHILSGYLNSSFFFLPTAELKKQLELLLWTDYAKIERVWPDTLSITIEEKKPIAFWNDSLITLQGKILPVDSQEAHSEALLPYLKGSEDRVKDVLQTYQKLGKILTGYGLSLSSLQLKKSQSWDLVLANGIQLHLGKDHLDQRVERFCRAYPFVFADKLDKLMNVDLRYASGMAVEWKGMASKKREDNG